jgi:hypothetical protein
MTSKLRLVTIAFTILDLKCHKLIHHLCVHFYHYSFLQLQGLQYHLDIIKSQQNLSNHNWKDLDFTKWTITEQLQKPLQKDRYTYHICFIIIVTI